MATVKGPLMSMAASGTVAGAIVYSSWKGRPVVRRHAVPSNPKSGLQVGLRAVFKYITQAWGALSAAQKAKWDDLAAARNITPLNAHVADAQDRARRNLGWRISTSEAAGTTPDAPTDPTATEQPKTLVLSWTRPAGNKGDYTAVVYMSTETSFTADISNLVGVVDCATTELTVPNLVTGTEYFFLVRETNVDGELGTLSAEGSGTPD